MARRSPTVAVALLAALTLVVSACTTGSASTAADPIVVSGPQGDGAESSETGSPQSDSAGAPTAAGSDPAAADGGDEQPALSAAEVAARIEQLPTALDVPEFRPGPEPIAISFPAIGVEGSPIDGVGVEPNGELEVPEARRVGWYEYGPSPGQDGSSVLAGHIAADGIDGVFRRLADAEPGDRFDLEFRTGERASFEIIEMAQYDKDELPLPRVFARDGRPVVTLITCGGDFQPSLGSYEDNIVAYAVPVEP